MNLLWISAHFEQYIPIAVFVLGSVFICIYMKAFFSVPAYSVRSETVKEFACDDLAHAERCAMAIVANKDISADILRRGKVIKKVQKVAPPSMRKR